MLRTRLPALAATTLLLVAALAFGADAASGSCPDAADVTVLPSPVSPWKGAPLRVMVVSGKPIQGVLSLIAPDGSVAAKSADRLGGSAPYSWFAEVAVPASVMWHATLTRDVEGYLLEAIRPVQVNGQPVSRALLRPEDRSLPRALMPADQRVRLSRIHLTAVMRQPLSHRDWRPNTGEDFPRQGIK